MDGQPQRSPPSRGVAFRVCTADDYSLQQRRENVRRRAGQPTTTACRMCRLRKVKCVEGPEVGSPRTSRRAGSSPRSNGPWRCQPCQQADLECQWNMIDKRKRRKGQVQVAQNIGSESRRTRTANSPPVPRTAATSEAARYTQTQAGEKETPLAAIGSLETTNVDAAGSPSQLLPGGAIAQGAAIQIPSFLASTFNMPSQATPRGDGSTSQPVLTGIYPEGTMQPQSWTDFQDCLFGLDFMEDTAGTIDMDGGYPTLALTPGQAQTRSSDGKPTASRAIRLRYYRRFGPTAAVPGLRKLALVLDPSEQEDHEAQHLDNMDASLPTINTMPTPQALSSSPSSVASYDSRLFDSSSRKPHPEIMPHILDVFFEHFGGHFPFLHPQILGGHVRSEEASSFLLNAIAALTVRFCSLDGPLAILQEKFEVPWRRGSPFLVKAKEQLVPLLSIPAPEVVDGLMILAWAEFGDNNEAGLWMFAGMAIRMAQDLGLNRNPDSEFESDINFHDQARPSPDGTYILSDEQSTLHQQKARLVIFWSVFILDVCVSLVTGRPPSIRRSEIEVPIPTFSDMKLLQLDFEKEVTMENMIFPATVGIMVDISEAVELLNQMTPSRNSDKSSTAPVDQHEALSRVRETLVQRYSMLPTELVFSIENFKSASASNQSGIFLMLHLFFYTVLTLVSHDHSRDASHDLYYARSRRPSASNILGAMAQESPLGPEGSLRPNTSVVACQKILQILSVSELVDSSSYLASPFTNHCLFVAASTLLRHISLSQSSHEQQRDSVFALNANADYFFMHNKLQDQATYFGGIKSVVAVLEHRQRALMGAGQQTNMDEEEAEEGMHRVAALDDPGIVNRYSIPGQTQASER